MNRAIEIKFWSAVDTRSDPLGCWLWKAGKTSGGYGLMTIPPKTRVYVHRWAYERWNGPISEGQVIDHICHTPSCVNPDHIRSCTQKQNTENLRSIRKNNKQGLRLGLRESACSLIRMRIFVMPITRWSRPLLMPAYLDGEREIPPPPPGFFPVTPPYTSPRFRSTMIRTAAAGLALFAFCWLTAAVLLAVLP